MPAHATSPRLRAFQRRDAANDAAYPAANERPLRQLRVLALAALPAIACDPSFAPAEVGAPIARTGVPAPIDDRNELRDYVAQCEAVLGPIPEISCDPAAPAPGTHVTRIPVLVDGLPIGLYDTELDDAVLAERAVSGEYSCDFPSIGGDFACSVGSTLVQYQDEANPNVQWVGLCRGVAEDTPAYDRFIGNGLIGANSLTGEMCFFFGKNPEPEAPYELPRLSSHADDLGPWLPPRDMPGSCLSCHPNNDPWIMTPWLQPDYMRATLLQSDYPLTLPEGADGEELFAARFVTPTPLAARTLLPEPLPAGRTGWTEEEIFDLDGNLAKRQYRAVGSSYVAAEAEGSVLPRTGMKPDSWFENFRTRLMLTPDEQSCARGCHAVANENFERMAHDSLGSKYATKYLSDSMSEGDMPGHEWMPPVAGPVDAWRELYESAPAPSIPAITECPLPKRVDETPTVEVVCGEPGTPGQATIRWRYTNDFGDVPGRDDVRFDVAVASGPAAQGVRGVSRDSEHEGVAMRSTADVHVVHDVAPDRDGLSSWRIDVPFTGDHGVIVVDVQPKRFCFEEPDRRPHAYATPTRVEIDLDDACG